MKKLFFLVTPFSISEIFNLDMKFELYDTDLFLFEVVPAKLKDLFGRKLRMLIMVLFVWMDYFSDVKGKAVF